SGLQRRLELTKSLLKAGSCVIVERRQARTPSRTVLWEIVVMPAVGLPSGKARIDHCQHRDARLAVLLEQEVHKGFRDSDFFRGEEDHDVRQGKPAQH